jgi:hypothetical protein
LALRKAAFILSATSLAVRVPRNGDKGDEEVEGGMGSRVN